MTTQKLIEEIRKAFAEYRRAEGCSCCRDIEKHEIAENKLAKLLQVDRYSDDSGNDWRKYLNKEDQ